MGLQNRTGRRTYEVIYERPIHTQGRAETREGVQKEPKVPEFLRDLWERPDWGRAEGHVR